MNVTPCDDPQVVNVRVDSEAETGPDGLTETTTGAPVSALHDGSLPLSWILHAITTLLPGSAETSPRPFDLDVVCRSGCGRAQRHDRHRDDQTKAAKLAHAVAHDEVANGSREDHVDSDESEHAATLEEKHSQRLRNLGEAHDVRDDQQRGGEAEPECRDEIDRAEAAVVLADPWQP